MAKTCLQCGNKFSYIANHWSHPHSKCRFPKLSKRQKDVLTGLLMGDGNVDNREGKIQGLEFL